MLHLSENWAQRREEEKKYYKRMEEKTLKEDFGCIKAEGEPGETLTGQIMLNGRGRYCEISE